LRRETERTFIIELNRFAVEASTGYPPLAVGARLLETSFGYCPSNEPKSKGAFA
jgi:hypothetical protein